MPICGLEAIAEASLELATTAVAIKILPLQVEEDQPSDTHSEGSIGKSVALADWSHLQCSSSEAPVVEPVGTLACFTYKLCLVSASPVLRGNLMLITHLTRLLLRE